MPLKIWTPFTIPPRTLPAVVSTIDCDGVFESPRAVESFCMTLAPIPSTEAFSRLRRSTTDKIAGENVLPTA
jgi:hypothetical protein